MTFRIPSAGGVRTAAQYQLYPRHVKAPQVTPTDRAVRVAGSLTNAIKIILKEPNRDVGRHGQALEQPTKIFETTTEKLGKRHENRTQTSSTPKTKEKFRTTLRVHSRLTRNNTPGMIPHRKATPIINKERDKESFPQPPISEGGKNSEGGQKKVRNRTIYPISEREKIKREKRNHSPVWFVAQPISARDTRQQNGRLTNKYKSNLTQNKTNKGIKWNLKE